MTRITTLAIAVLLPLCAPDPSAGQTAPPPGVAEGSAGFAHGGTPADPLPPQGLSIEQFLWTARPLIVFADTPHDPNFQRQMQLLAADPAALLDRQVVVIADTDPAQPSALRTRFRPNGFAILLVDTNGRVLLTRPAPRNVREISAAIDKSPQRRQELQDRRSGG